MEGCGRFELGCERFHGYRRIDWLYWKVLERYLEDLPARLTRSVTENDLLDVLRIQT